MRTELRLPPPLRAVTSSDTCVWDDRRVGTAMSCPGPGAVGCTLWSAPPRQGNRTPTPCPPCPAPWRGLTAFQDRWACQSWGSVSGTAGTKVTFVSQLLPAPVELGGKSEVFISSQAQNRPPDVGVGPRKGLSVPRAESSHTRPRGAGRASGGARCCVLELSGPRSRAPGWGSPTCVDL